MPIGPMQFGTVNNAGVDQTTLTANNITTTFLVENPTWEVVTARGGDVGVHASANPDSELGAGVFATGAIGVFGQGRTRGILGDSFGASGGAGDGVQGRTDVQGRNAVFGDHFGEGFGVRGHCGAGFGVFGVSTSSVGVGGESDSSFGVQGSTTGGGFAGAFFGRTAVVGDLSVFGNFTVVPPGVKSMVMPHSDGSYRRLYSMESPECWFEDFGTGELIEGRAHVELDPDYVATVQPDDYHVFLTPEGDSMGLYVADKSPTGFDVREQQNGTSSLRFSYRVAARRKTVEGERLERFAPVDVSQPMVKEAATSSAEPLEVPEPGYRHEDEAPAQE